MAVYVDEAIWPWRGQVWCHLLADSLDELHAFARQLRMSRSWFQEPPKASRPHYDLNERRRAWAVKLGAIEIDRRRTVELSKKLLSEWKQRQEQGTPVPPPAESANPQLF